MAADAKSFCLCGSTSGKYNLLRLSVKGKFGANVGNTKPSLPTEPSGDCNCENEANTLSKFRSSGVNSEATWRTSSGQNCPAISRRRLMSAQSLPIVALSAYPPHFPESGMEECDGLFSIIFE